MCLELVSGEEKVLGVGSVLTRGFQWVSGVDGGCADLHRLPVRLPWLYQIYNWGGNLGDYENVAIYYFHEVNK